jgi:hypothetical protein
LAAVVSADLPPNFQSASVRVSVSLGALSVFRDDRTTPSIVETDPKMGLDRSAAETTPALAIEMVAMAAEANRFEFRMISSWAG